MGFWNRISNVINKNRFTRLISYLFLTALVYFVMILWDKFLPDDLWMFHEAADISFLYMWLISISLIACDQNVVAMAITIGNAVGIVIGQFLGDLVYSFNSFKVTDDMDVQAIHHLMQHRGIFIWIYTILLFTIVSVLLEIVWYKRRKSINVKK